MVSGLLASGRGCDASRTLGIMEKDDGANGHNRRGRERRRCVDAGAASTSRILGAGRRLPAAATGARRATRGCPVDSSPVDCSPTCSCCRSNGCCIARAQDAHTRLRTNSSRANGNGGNARDTACPNTANANTASRRATSSARPVNAIRFVSAACSPGAAGRSGGFAGCRSEPVAG